jgi:hypothetical protein
MNCHKKLSKKTNYTTISAETANMLQRADAKSQRHGARVVTPLFYDGFCNGASGSKGARFFVLPYLFRNFR